MRQVILRRRPTEHRAARLARKLDDAMAKSIAEREELRDALARCVDTAERWKAIAHELLPGNVRPLRGPRTPA